MQLVARQSIAAGVELRCTPEALERGPGFVASCRFVAVDGFHDEAHTGTFQQRGPLVGFENAVLECSCHDLNHVCQFLYDLRKSISDSNNTSPENGTALNTRSIEAVAPMVYATNPRYDVPRRLIALGRAETNRIIRPPGTRGARGGDPAQIDGRSARSAGGVGFAGENRGGEGGGADSSETRPRRCGHVCGQRQGHRDRRTVPPA